MAKIIILFLLALTCFPAYSQFHQARSSGLFDGNDDYMDGGTSNRNITNTVTLEAWIRTNSATTQWVAGKHSAAANQGFYLYLQNGKAAFAGSNTSGAVVSSGFSISDVNDGHWHHVAGIYANGIWQVWVDGVQENRSPAGSGAITLTSQAPFTIAKNSNQNQQYFNGRLAEIRLWNTARTEAEIRANMCRVLKNISPDLAAYYKLDWWNEQLTPSQSNMVKDNSGFGILGTLSGNVNYTTNMGPPVGDESLYYYGPDKANQIFKLGAILGDTLTLNYLSGNSKGIHFYRSDSYPIIDAKAIFITIPYFFGVYTAGDPDAVYQISYAFDTTICNVAYYLHTRIDGTLPFRKITPGMFDPINDKAYQFTDTYRGEYVFLPRDIVSVHFNGQVTLCPENLNTTLTASAGESFLWSTGENTKSINVTQPGKYFVKTIDFCSAVSTDTFRVVTGPPVKLPGIKSADTTICDNNPLFLSLPKGFLYQWPDGSITETFSINAAGTYSLKVTDPRCGNSLISTIRVKTVACSPEKVFIPNIITPNNDGLNDKFTVVGLPPGQWGLSIFNRWGKQVYQSFRYQNDWDAEGLSDGIYYYYFRSGTSEKTFKGFVEVVR